MATYIVQFDQGSNQYWIIKRRPLLGGGEEETVVASYPNNKMEAKAAAETCRALNQAAVNDLLDNK